MKKLWVALLLCAVGLSACRHGKTTGEDPQQDTVSASVATEPDSTLYGTSVEFGMSTFGLATDGGDTLYVTRTASDGTDGAIAGSLEEGKRYAMTTRDGGEAIGSLINLSQLEKFTKDYKVANGRLVLLTETGADTVTVESLTEKELVATGSGGRVYKFPR